MALFSGAIAELLEPRLRKVYFRELDSQPELYSQVFNVQKSTRAFEDSVKMGGFGNLAVKGEGQPIAYDDPVISARKRTVHTVYALGFRVTMEAVADELYNVIDQMPADLADATRNHQENLAWGVFNDADTGAVHTIINGDNLAQNHNLLKLAGGQYNNLQNPAVALSVTGMEDLLTLARTMVDESGRFKQIGVQTLVVPPELEFEAARLLETSKEMGEPGTAENQINTVATNRIGVRALVVPYLTSATAYYLVSPKNQHSLCWFNRMAVTFGKPSKDTATKDTLYDVMYRAHVTVDDWKGFWMSAG